MNQILYSGKAKKNYTIIIIAAVVVVLLLFISLFGFGIINLWNKKILKGVVAANVNVSEMTQEEAAMAIHKAYRETPTKRVDLVDGDRTITIYSDEIGYAYSDAEQLAEEAYAYGRDGNIIANNFTVLRSYFNAETVIGTEATISQKDLENVVNAVLGSDNEFSQNDGYQISGDQLLLTKGTQGRKIDFAILAERVLKAFNENERTVALPVITSAPVALDLDKVYETIHKEPVNATYQEGENFEIIKEEDGIDFDLAEAKQKYEALASGETAEVALKVTKAEVTLESLSDVLFRTEIASYSSKYDTTNQNMVANMELATNKCNGVVLYPGEMFSFHRTVGDRTTANGYRASEAYVNGKTAQEVGAGVSQVASTLYNAALRADLSVTQREANEVYVSYVPQSTDALINEKTDLQLKNDRKYPVKLVMTCGKGVCTASIYGYKEENEGKIEVETKLLETIKYETERQNDASMTKGTTKVVQKPVNGYVSEAYKVYYNTNGEETNRKLISKDTYQAVKEIVKVGTKVTKPPVVTPEPVVTTPNPTPSIILPPGWDNPESGY